MHYPLTTTSYLRGKSSFRTSSSQSPPPPAFLEEETPEADGATRYKRKIVHWKKWQKEIHVYFHYDSWFLSLSSLFHCPSSVPVFTTPTAALTARFKRERLLVPVTSPGGSCALDLHLDFIYFLGNPSSMSGLLCMTWGGWRSREGEIVLLFSRTDPFATFNDLNSIPSKPNHVHLAISIMTLLFTCHFFLFVMYSLKTLQVLKQKPSFNPGAPSF